MNKETDLAWLAGVFDGEGCISISPRYRSGSVSLSQQNKEFIELILVLCAKLKLSEPVLHLPTSHSLGFTLYWNGQWGTKFLAVVLPYLHHPWKCKQAKIYMKFFDPSKRHKKRPKEKDMLILEWQELKRCEEQEKQRLRDTFCKE